MLELDERVDDGVSVLSLQGEIDLTTSDRVRDGLIDLLAHGGRPVVVDLEGVEFMDSTGLSALVAGYNLARREGHVLVFACDDGKRIRKLFDITGLAQVIRIRATLADAVQEAAATAPTGGDVERPHDPATSATGDLTGTGGAETVTSDLGDAFND